MKLLTKVKIINWHYFWNETIDIKPIVFLTGLNGSGKSTLIDALQVVLLGDTSGRFFNKAASEKSARTLKGYLRGELGDSLDGGFKYLRNGRFTSYIALEFHDDFNNNDFTMGIVFDTFDSGDEEHSFFFFKDKIPANEFIQNKIPMDRKTLTNFLSEKQVEFKFFPSNRQYQDFLRIQLGGLKEKYFGLLKKATSFSPITDITTFITEYVCDEQSNVNLDLLQENILEYKKLEVEAKNMAERVEKLEAISQVFQSFSSNKQLLDVAIYIVDKCELENSKDKLDLLKKQIENSKDRLLKIDTEVLDLREQVNKLDREKLKLTSEKANDDVSKIINDLMSQKQNIKEQIEDIEENSNYVSKAIVTLCDSYMNAISNLLTNLNNFDLNVLDEEKADELRELTLACDTFSKDCMNFKMTYSNNLKLLTRVIYDEFRTKLVDFKDKVSSLAITISRSINQISKKITTLESEELLIKQGKKTYPDNYETIKNLIEDGLVKKFNKPIPVNFYCDLIDIIDSSWTNAIEGYLGNSRFNLFVEPKYFTDAYQILKEIINRMGYKNIAIIDQEKLIEKNFQAEYGSLAEEIKTIHNGARAYTNFLIGRLYKCDSIKEAQNSGRGITKNCDLYQNYSLSTINPRFYTSSFIGTNVSKRSADEKGLELKASKSNLNTYRSLNVLISGINNLETISKSEIDNTFMLISKVPTLDGLKKNLTYIDEQLESHDTTLIEGLDRRIKDIENDIVNLNKKIEDALIEKGRLETDIKNIAEEKIAKQNEEIKEIKTRLSNSLNVSKDAETLFEQRKLEGKTNSDILFEFNTKNASLNYTIQKQLKDLSILRGRYCNEYHLSYDVNSENNDLFDKDLHEYKDVKLPEYQEKIQDSYHKAIQQFKDDFINKLRDAITNVQKQVEDLNEALQQASFGRDMYRFTVDPNPIYRRYYDMLMDDIVLNLGEDQTEFLDKYKEVMDDLFKQIIDTGNNEKNSELMKNVEKFADYRHYLIFDLIVYNKDTSDEQRLSAMLKKKSGGETQTPFYIAVLASFAQLYHVNHDPKFANTSRIIIFDEAFSKMDKGRIKESVKLLRKFNLQVILSAPSDKVGDISELVDETLVVLHERNSSCVKLYAKDGLK